MATAKQKEEVTVEDLAAQLEALKKDIAELSGTASRFARQRGEEAMNEARSRAGAAYHRGEEGLETLERKLAALPDGAMSAARRDPAMALAVAAGLGFLFGFVTGRK